MPDPSASADAIDICPRCHTGLAPRASDLGVHLVCPACSGRQINLSLLRREMDPGFVRGLWAAVRDAPPTHHHDALDCPCCRNKMHPAGLARGDSEIQVDVSRHCQLIWLDAGEMDFLPGYGDSGEVRKNKESNNLPQQAREILAMREVEKIRRGNDPTTVGEAPAEWWQVLFTYFGFPIEEDAPEPEIKPIVTWITAGLCVLVFLLQLVFYNHDLSEHFGFLPIQPWRHGGLTLISSFFLHGGLLHLAINTWFLYLLGDNCESLLGRMKYSVMLAAGALAGLCLHSIMDPNGYVPVVGASAGISAVLVFYALSLPSVRLVFCLRLGFYPVWFRLSAVWAMAIWLVSQAVTAVLQVHGMTNVSAFGHFGGALVGLGFFWWSRRAGAGLPAQGDFTNPAAVIQAMRRNRH